MMMWFGLIFYKASISIVDAMLPESVLNKLWYILLLKYSFPAMSAKFQATTLLILMRFLLLCLKRWLPFDLEWKRIASVFVLKLFALIKVVYSNVSFGSIKHIGTITQSILDISIKHSIFPQNKFIPVIMLRG